MKNLFIHLNLCIALALGLIVFIAGIERATNNEACAAIRTVLQLSLECIRMPIGGLQVRSCSVAVYFYICLLLDVM